MENANRWYFTKDELASTPSRKSGIDANKELSYRQQAANFIQDMGQRLQVTQLCINTAIVYMHRFYVFHSFSEVHRNSLSVAALFLAAKVEEQPRKLEHVIKVAHVCLHKDSPPLDVRTEAFAEKQFEVVAHENVLLQTLGFVLAIEHPHTYVVKVCQLVKASKDLAQTSYFMATTSLHMTTMCLQYRPTVVACVCIHLACKWSSWKIEPCSEGKEWYYYVDKSVTLDLLETLTQEFIAILETSPHKFKRCTKFNAQKDNSGHGSKTSVEYNLKQHVAENKFPSMKKEVFSPGPSTSFNLCPQMEEKCVPAKIEGCEKVFPVPSQPPSPPKRHKPTSHSISIDAYREKKEKERIEQTAVEPSLKVLQNESEKAFKDTLSSVVEQSLKDKDQLQPNHQVFKAQSPVQFFKKENKSLKIGVSNDPVVVLERVDAKNDADDLCRTEVPPAKNSATEDQKHHVRGDLNCSSKEFPSIASITSMKSKHKVNSVHNCHSSPQSETFSPARDLAANGSKELCKRSTDNSIDHKIEKEKRHKSKHSSKNKSLINHSEHSNPSIKVKIRKDIIVLPEKSQKATVENPKKPLKIKLPKPPSVDSTRNPVSTPIKLVITKDKSGSGSYCTSHKNDREPKKRAHSPASQDSIYKNHGETKHARLEHSHPAVKQSRVSSQNVDPNDYLSVDVGGSQSYYNHYFPYHITPHRGKTDSNPPLPPFPPPQPPPPPE